MPVLPGSEQAQVMNPSSPVPVGGTEGARYQGELVAQFGGALSALGDALDVAGKRAKQEQDKIDVELALSDFKIKMLEEKANQQAAGAIPNDVTGFGAVHATNKRLRPAMAQIAQRIGDPGVQSKFLAAASNMFSDEAASIHADEVKKRVALLESSSAMLTSKRAQEAKHMGEATGDPVRDVEKSLSNVRMIIGAEKLRIYDNADLADAVKPIQARDAAQTIALAHVNGYLERAQQGIKPYDNFNMAFLALEKLSAPVDEGGSIISEKEKQKAFDNIMSTQASYYKVAEQRDQTEERVAKKRLEESQMQNYKRMHGQLMVTGNNELGRVPILRDIEVMRMDGKLSDKQATELATSKIFSNNADNLKEFEIMSKLLKTGNINGALSSVEKAIYSKSGGLSMERGTELLTRLQNYKERQRNNPERNMRIQKLFRALAREQEFDLAHPMLGKAINPYNAQQRLNNAEEIFLRGMDNVSDDGLFDLFNRARREAFGKRDLIKIPHTNYRYSDTDKPERVREDLARFSALAREEKKKTGVYGKKTKETVLGFKATIEELTRLQDLKSKEKESVKEYRDKEAANKTGNKSGAVGNFFNQPATGSGN